MLFHPFSKPLCAGFSALIFGLASICSQAAEAQKYNVIIMMSDDVGFGDASHHGWGDVRTPSLDRLAQQGVSFSNGYVVSPMCGPSRAGLLTGRYPQRWGSDWNYNESWPEDRPTIATWLGDNGYATACFGKWHGTGREPKKSGFDQFFGFFGAQQGGNGSWMLDEGYFTDVYTDKGLEFMRAAVNADQPFFLYLPYGTCHVPMHIPPGYEEEFTHVSDETRREFLCMQAAMDANRMRVLDEVESLGIAQQTLIIYLSDNGGYYKNASSNQPLAGAKLTLWEGGIRVPMIWSLPGVLPQGVEYKEVISTLDIAATFLPLTGTSATEALDGANVLPWLTGQVAPPAERTLCFTIYGGRQKACRLGDWKWIKPAADGTDQLYNLANDIGETEDLADQHPEKLQEVKAAFDAWSSENPQLGQDGEGALDRYLREAGRPPFLRPLQGTTILF